MRFAYYFLIQDILGVLIIAMGIRLAQVYFVMMKNRGIKRVYMVCMVGSLLLAAAGGNLLFFPWGWQTWAVSGGLFITGRLLGTLVNWIEVS